MPEEASQLETTHTVAAVDNLEEPNLPQTSDSGWLNEPSYPPQGRTNFHPYRIATN